MLLKLLEKVDTWEARHERVEMLREAQYQVMIVILLLDPAAMRPRGEFSANQCGGRPEVFSLQSRGKHFAPIRIFELLVVHPRPSSLPRLRQKRNSSETTSAIARMTMSAPRISRASGAFSVLCMITVRVTSRLYCRHSWSRERHWFRKRQP